ncbi:MAG: hypothetical protein WC372_08700 [Candidatus Neomarinimicrobiota bacterium]|nr:hypothetical protein [bacterium]
MPEITPIVRKALRIAEFGMFRGGMDTLPCRDISRRLAQLLTGKATGSPARG